MQNTNEQQKETRYFQKLDIATIQGGLFADLKGNEVKVLLMISTFQNENGECFPSQSTLAELCGMSRSAVNTVVKKLCDYRTNDGEAILEKRTERQGREITRTFYKVLPAAGIHFGHGSKAVAKKEQPIQDGEHCENSSKVVAKTEQPNVKDSEGGCYKNATLIRATNQSQTNNSQIEQDIKELAIVEDKKESLSKNNNVIDNKELKIVAKDKESNKAIIEKPKEVQSDIVEDYEVKRIAASIVANGRGKSNIKEDTLHGGHMGSTAADTASKQTTEGKSPSLSEIARMQSEASRKAKEKAEAERNMKRKKESSLLLQSIAYKTSHVTDTASDSLSKVKPIVQEKPHTERIQAVEDDGESFDEMCSRLFG